jgi:adenylate cyclase
LAKKETYWVEFNQEGLVPVAIHQSLLEASLSAGIPMFHLCGGQARCSTCRILVLEGEEWLAPPNQKELELRETMTFPSNVRLACQTQVRGNSVKVTRIIRDDSDITLYVNGTDGECTRQIGTEKELILFFLDIRHFTPFVESHLAFDVIHIVRKLFTAFHTILDSNGGKIVETAGDSIYAIFGWEGALAENASAAVRTGFAILGILEELNASYFSTHFGQNIQVGIGIHAGLTIGGNIRLGRQDHLVVMGHAVNVAARLQSATRELNNSFLISEAVYQLLPTPLSHDRTFSMQLRGVLEPLCIYLLGKPYD